MTVNVHKPKDFQPEDYDYVGCFATVMSDQADAFYDDQRDLREWQREAIWELLYKSPASVWPDLERCDHCGAHIAYVAVLKHKPTGDHIAMGQQCLGNRFRRSNAEFKALMKETAALRKQERIKTRCAAYLVEHPDAERIADYDGTNSFVADLGRKLRQYGELSERQLSAGLKAIEDADKPKEPAEQPIDAPEGTVTFTGEVTSVKTYDSDYGPTLKMTVKVSSDAGCWRVWFTVPESLRPFLDPKTGDKVPLYGNYQPPSSFGIVGKTVTLTANLKRSAKDASFALGKRPRGSSVLESASV